jgi:hypothetical protein
MQILARRGKDRLSKSNHSSEEETKELGERYNGGKPALSLLLECPHALSGLASTLEFGMAKYSRGNYLRGLPHTEIVDSLMRHLVDYMGGQELDVDSGLRHVDHVLANALFLAELTARHPQLDDRSEEVLNAKS